MLFLTQCLEGVRIFCLPHPSSQWSLSSTDSAIFHNSVHDGAGRWEWFKETLRETLGSVVSFAGATSECRDSAMAKPAELREGENTGARQKGSVLKTAPMRSYDLGREVDILGGNQEQSGEETPRPPRRAYTPQTSWNSSLFLEPSLMGSPLKEAILVTFRVKIRWWGSSGT